MASYTVTDVREGNRDNYGNQAYYIDTVEGPEGVYFKCKPKNAPQVGQSYEWELEEGEYGPRFRRPAQEQGSGGNSPQGGAQRRSGGGGGFRGKTPEDDRKITRLAAHKVAVEVVNPTEDWDKFEALCDILCDDAFKYAEKGGGGTPAAPSLDQMRQQLQAALKEAQIPVTDGVAAIGSLYGRATLEATDDINAIVHKAKELANEETPF